VRRWGRWFRSDHEFGLIWYSGLSIGAGGAITWLSDRDAEWDEVLTKVRSVVGVLDGVE
jgi:anthranilate/para-aminobenzoate synthase component I